ncbi:MAG: hypothetical protein EZS28_046271, partial [Streblomastix strix]
MSEQVEIEPAQPPKAIILRPGPQLRTFVPPPATGPQRIVVRKEVVKNSHDYVKTQTGQPTAQSHVTQVKVVKERQVNDGEVERDGYTYVKKTGGDHPYETSYQAQNRNTGDSPYETTYQAQNRNAGDNPYETTYQASNQNAGQAGERAQGRGVDAQYDHLAHGNALGDGSDNADRNRIQKRPQTAADGYQRRYEEQREFKNEIRSSPSNVKKQEYSIS